MRRIFFFILIIIAEWVSSEVHAAQTAVISQIRIQETVSSAQLQFTLTRSVAGRVYYHPRAKQILVEFKDARMDRKIMLSRKRPLIAEVKIEQVAGPVLRFVFILKKNVKWKFTFKQGTPAALELFLKAEKKGPISPVRLTEARSDHPVDVPHSLPKKTVPPIILKNLIQNDMEREAPITRAIIPAKLPGSGSRDSGSAKNPGSDVKKNLHQRRLTIVIDPGHGGKDTGAISAHGRMEKTVVLAISKQLVTLLNQNPRFHATLSRDGDYFIPLRARLILARRANADLFISIHADAALDASASGSSVFALSPHGATTEAARWLARRENAELGDVNLNALKDRSPMLRSILIDLAQTATIQASLRLGNQVLDQLELVNRLHYTHVEQAPFMVLKSPDIPSILIETGFISHPQEEVRLADPLYQKRIALGIAKAIQAYAQKQT